MFVLRAGPELVNELNRMLPGQLQVPIQCAEGARLRILAESSAGFQAFENMKRLREDLLAGSVPLQIPETTLSPGR